LPNKTITTAHWKTCSGLIKKLRICFIFHLLIHFSLLSIGTWCSRNGIWNG
jgi:hypothetical protein